MIGRASTSRVARLGHPSFIAAAVSATLLSFATARAAAANGCRLAGIVAIGPDYLGFLELPGGGP